MNGGRNAFETEPKWWLHGLTEFGRTLAPDVLIVVRIVHTVCDAGREMPRATRSA